MNTCLSAPLLLQESHFLKRYQRGAGLADRGTCKLDILDMGLMTILRKVKESEKEMRILILGLDNAGKTTIVKKLKGEDVHTVSPTLGFDINTLNFNEFKLNLWDVGGQQTIRAYWRNYFEQTDGIIWVVDSADALRMADCRIELENLLMEERLAGASLLVLANKQDITDALTTADIVQKLSLNSVVGRKRHWRVFACSAYSDISSDGDKNDIDDVLTQSLQWLVDDIASRIFISE